MCVCVCVDGICVFQCACSFVYKSITVGSVIPVLPSLFSVQTPLIWRLCLPPQSGHIHESWSFASGRPKNNRSCLKRALSHCPPVLSTLFPLVVSSLTLWWFVVEVYSIIMELLYIYTYMCVCVCVCSNSLYCLCCNANRRGGDK